MVISSFYRPPSKTDDAHMKTASKKSPCCVQRIRRSQSSFWAVTLMLLTFHGKTTPSLVQSITHVESVRHLSADLGLEQMVHFLTRGDNTLDLIFTSHQSYQERCKPLPPVFAKSGHDIILFDTAHQPVRARLKRRTIYLWKKADSEGIKKALTTYSESFFSTTLRSVNSMWQESTK